MAVQERNLPSQTIEIRESLPDLTQEQTLVIWNAWKNGGSRGFLQDPSMHRRFVESDGQFPWMIVMGYDQRIRRIAQKMFPQDRESFAQDARIKLSEALKLVSIIQKKDTLVSLLMWS